MRRRWLWFAVSGALAFVIDAGVVQLLVGVFNADPYLARLLSFLLAVTFTWGFNRSITFRAEAGRASVKQWATYLSTQLGGFVVNYGVYAAMLALWPLVHLWPVIGVAAGSLAGMVVNYLAARHWVFRPTGRD